MLPSLVVDRGDKTLVFVQSPIFNLGAKNHASKFLGIKYKFNLIFLSDLGLFLITWEAANQMRVINLFEVVYQDFNQAD